MKGIFLILSIFLWTQMNAQVWSMVKSSDTAFAATDTGHKYPIMYSWIEHGQVMQFVEKSYYDYWRNRALKNEMKIGDLRDSLSKCENSNKPNTSITYPGDGGYGLTGGKIEVQIGKADTVFSGVISKIRLDGFSMDSLSEILNNYDTVPCIMLVCDTSDNVKDYTITSKGEYPNYEKKQDGFTYWTRGFEVREKHNTSEGSVDPGGQMCVDGMGLIIPCFHDYWKHIGYLNFYKLKMRETIVVWNSIPLK